jgi:L-fuculose-phosphate aldolase
MNEETLALRREMVDICRRMNSSGINQGTAGNLSVRYGGGFLITPSSLPYDIMQPEDLVEMDFDASYEGRRPSSEWRFHRDILRERTDINVVLHCHSIYATTLACHHKTIPSFHYMTGVAGGSTIRCAKYATFGTQALSDNALEALSERKACLLGQHGQISLGETLEAGRGDGTCDRADASDELWAGSGCRRRDRHGAPPVSDECLNLFHSGAR